MKNISIILIILLSLFSCSDFLEEDLSAQLTPEGGSLTTLNGLNAALVGTYSPLSTSWRRGLSSPHTHAILMGADDLTTFPASNKAPFREFDQYNVSDANGRLAVVWLGTYKCIQGANNIIDNYQDASGDEGEINQIAGEAYFLRAYSYFWIVRLWGQAPLVLESQAYDVASLSISASSEQMIYDQILLDLEQAISLMGDSKLAPGRVSKGTALATQAEVYLQMAGWPLNQADKYAMAATAAKNLIDNEGTYGFGLMDNYADLFVTPTSNNDGNREEVLSFTFAGTGDFFTFNASRGNPAMPGEDTGWNDYYSELGFFNNFPNQVRKDVTFQTETEFPKGSGTIIQFPDFLTQRPHFKKNQSDVGSWRNTNNLTLERMAEVYFIYAEAQVMATGNTMDPDALEAVNKIVRRAYGLPLNTPDPSVDYTALTQAQIVQEKAWEFAAEYSRWFDIVRLQMIPQIVAEKDPADLQPIGALTNYYLPIPASETLVNPNLTGG
ncbi:MAG: RagB/SusD family nutrient uptake outer membrane protein [Cyclobacteriaceae bacterium]|nr:RagB/SusD family nutrient uptake outer membrane protein [Cyclobacteriaceae bacterium]